MRICTMHWSRLVFEASRPGSRGPVQCRYLGCPRNKEFRNTRALLKKPTGEARDGDDAESDEPEVCLVTKTAVAV